MKKIFYLCTVLFTAVTYSSEKPLKELPEEEITQKIATLKEKNTKKFDAEYFKAHTKCTVDCSDCTERMAYVFKISEYQKELERRKSLIKKLETIPSLFENLNQ